MSSQINGITMAVAKGRMLKDVLPCLSGAGFAPLEDPSTTRRLVLETEDDKAWMMVVRSADVPTYVRYGVADVGIVGKDVIMESATDLYELMDLRVSRCRLVVAQEAERREHAHSQRRVRVASKFPNVARSFFAQSGVQAEIIHLYGSMELAPISGLSDKIVDVVDTGSTLRANNLVEVETIAQVSARLVVNPAAYKIKRKAIDAMIERLCEHVTPAPNDQRHGAQTANASQ